MLTSPPIISVIQILTKPFQLVLSVVVSHIINVSQLFHIALKAAYGNILRGSDKEYASLGSKPFKLVTLSVVIGITVDECLCKLGIIAVYHVLCAELPVADALAEVTVSGLYDDYLLKALVYGEFIWYLAAASAVKVRSAVYNDRL